MLSKDRRLPLRLILVVPFVIQIFGAVGLTGDLSMRSGQKAAELQASQIQLIQPEKMSDLEEQYWE